jgi:membrane protease YdiL (CAAX protease family)
MRESQFFSWHFLSLAIIQPCVEEFVFRGVCQGVLLTWSCGRPTWHGLSVANGVTAGIFTLAHLWGHPPLWALAVLMPALAFGFCRDRYGSIYPAILLHVFYNAGYFTLTGLPG